VRKKTATENELAYQVKQAAYQLMYLRARQKLLTQQDSIFSQLVRATDLRFRTGESRLLEKTTAETQHNEIRNSLRLTKADILIYEQILQTLTGSEHPVTITEVVAKKSLAFSADTLAAEANPQLRYMQQQIAIAEGERKVSGAKVLPDITVGYFNQTLIGTLNESLERATGDVRFDGFIVGLTVPLWIGPHLARTKAARINEEKTQRQFEYNEALIQGQWQRAWQEYLKNQASIEYYESSALQNADLILRHSEAAFRNGEADYTEYFLSVRAAIRIKEEYLNTLNELNQSAINIEFLAGIK
jgi:cobalt-zinc-cadmium resistance protein CzcA